MREIIVIDIWETESQEKIIERGSDSECEKSMKKVYHQVHDPETY